MVNEAKHSLGDFFLKFKFEIRNCPICKSESFELLYKGDRHDIGITNVICNNCNHIYINPSPNLESLNYFYLNYYRDLYNSSSTPDVNYLNYHHPFIIGTTRNVADILFIYSLLNDLKSPSKVFDLGCAEGYFLSIFQRIQSNIIRDGLELNSKFLSYGLSNGWINKGFNTNIENFVFKEKYDIISSSHVLEHILDPVDFLSKLKSGLESSGVIFLEFPVGDRKDVGNYFHIAHVNHFTESSIRYLFELVGLNIYLLDRNGSRGSVDGSYRVIAGLSELKIDNYDYVHEKTDYVKLKNRFKLFRLRQSFLLSPVGNFLKSIKKLIG